MFAIDPAAAENWFQNSIRPERSGYKQGHWIVLRAGPQLVLPVTGTYKPRETNRMCQDLIQFRKLQRALIQSFCVKVGLPVPQIPDEVLLPNMIAWREAFAEGCDHKIVT